jgi:Flagellar biosynthesis/type III secretory pathway ATPase
MLKRANHFRRLWTLYQQNRDLIAVGAYERGTNPELDEAIQKRPLLEDFMRQDEAERFDFTATSRLLEGVV